MTQGFTGANQLQTVTADSGTASVIGQNINIVGTNGISTSASSDTVTIDGSGISVTPTIIAIDNTDSPYVAPSTSTYFSCDVTSGTLQINLPNAPSTGINYTVKDSAGNAATNNITVTTVGGAVTLDGSTTFVMNTSYEAANFIFNGTSYEVY